MKVKNVSPLGDLYVVLLRRDVEFGEVVEVTAEQGKELVSTGNFEPVKAGNQEG